MDGRKIIIGAFLTLIFTINGFSQELTQVIRGKVVDSETQIPLQFATVSILTTETPIGTITDEDGKFRLENIPIGRHNIQISFIGYEAKIIPELMITSGKEVVLNISLKESIEQLEEAVVKAYTKKDKPLNSMATLSARTFSTEEAQRYAGGFDDPARLASSFAGVSTGYLDDNGIIVRGNAPKGLLWRLEGIEIPNPNHFAGLTTFGGGGVSALSSLMLANSDFFTGAFPAEYGNAMSGVFDIKLRTGNNEKHERAIQLGALGLDISAEGPLSKNHRASYLFNYRYSTFGLIKPVLPEETNVPIYQDLSFKVNLPTENAGIFSIWALAADDNIKFEPEEDTAKWVDIDDREIGEATQGMGVVGLNHRYILNESTYLNTSLALSGDYIEYEAGELDYNLNNTPTEFIDASNYKYTFTSTLNRKLSAKYSNRVGFALSSLHYNTNIKYAPVKGDALINAVNEDGASNLIQAFSQSKYSPSPKLSMNFGLNAQYFDLNEELIIEPRAGITYHLNKKQSLSFAYGKHSRMEPLGIYFAEVESNNTINTPNKKLKLSKAHHLVLAYDASLNQNLRLKVEPYIQFLYDVPVIPDSSYSTINMEADWFFANKLTNEGTGTNMGIDLTLERFLKDGYYYLITASLFDSKYKGGDGKERNTRFNSNYVFNILFGKEWVVGADKNKIIGVNGRLNMLGGYRTTPVDVDLSTDLQEIQYDYTKPFEAQKPDVYHLNATITYRINKKKHSSIWSLQVINALGTKEFYGYSYNYKTKSIERDEVAVVVPNLSYKIEF